MQRFGRGAVAAAAIATSLGLASAAVSLYWAAGGTVLLDTAGVVFEQWGRERPPEVVVALWAIVISKGIAAVAPIVFVGVGAGQLPSWTRGAGRDRWDGSPRSGSPSTAACSRSSAF